MFLKITNDIEKNVFSTKITIDSFGTETLSPTEEADMLNDFPEKISFRSLSFKKNIVLEGNVPKIDDSGSGLLVSLPPLSNKEIILDENFEALYKIDTARISNLAVDGSVLTTKELVAQAYCLIFSTVICEAVERAMLSIRSKAPSFAGETLVEV